MHIHLQAQRYVKWNDFSVVNSWIANGCRKEMLIALYVAFVTDQGRGVCVNKYLGVQCRHYLTGCHRTTLKKSAVSSKAIERYVIMQLWPQKIRKSMQY